MFKNCSGLTSLGLSNFDTSHVLYMNDMFNGCSSLKSLYLGGWDISYAQYMSSMFDGCTSLESLYLSGWGEFHILCDMNYMFRNCNSLKTIRMVGCVESTVNKIKSALNDAGILDQVTIITE